MRAFNFQSKIGREVLANFEYITSIIETHWIQSYNCKDKIMNEEARTIANVYIVWCSLQNVCEFSLVLPGAVMFINLPSRYIKCNHGDRS